MTQTIVYLRDKNQVDLVLKADGSLKIDPNSISGLNVNVISGSITASISGQTVSLDKSSFSGVSVKTSPADLSGVSVHVGQADISGLNVILTNAAISGQNVKEFGSSLTTASQLTITNTSGGTSLGSGSVFKVIVRSISGNNVMYIGGTGGNAPFSGTGLELYGGESIALPVNNLNTVQIFATTSGQKITYLGYVT